ncbi:MULTISPECIES: peptidoglycan DD-metalloendopeptidase family protein [unclassified Chamaesiphon]|uniref:peptidoglycan DD-metalloendopeptidase family protein n=1 Tax=unclassified Chamaesiphon TaxID=2620921 RepID=UPI00286C4711|nr:MULTISPECIES: peptidoglycan DD-metalloendopeptidase family protein [unclassified Chamaesiphon]
MNKFLTVLASIACVTLSQNLVTHAASTIPQKGSSNDRTNYPAGNAIDKAEEFKPRQLIAQSCRNINLRPSNGRSLTLKRGTRGTTCGYTFNFQSDGNLVLYKSGQALWATGTDRRGEILVMQSDGNLVIYGGGRALWATNTDGNPGAFLAIQADGNLVIYKSNGQQPIWASNTAGAGQSAPSQPSQNSSQPIAPLTSLSTIPTCLFGTACMGGGAQHTGVDYFMDAGSNVRSICDGVVDYSSTNSANLKTIWNSFVIVRYNNCGGYQTLYAYYGHLNSQVSAGQNVQRGQTIGTLQDQGGNSHLHFGLATVKFNGGWGYQNGNLNAKGWIDPENFARKY